MLPPGQGSVTAEYELEYRHFRRRIDAEWDLLFLQGATQVCGAGEAGQENGLKGRMKDASCIWWLNCSTLAGRTECLGRYTVLYFVDDCGGL